MSDVLDEALRTAGSDLHLDTPLADVLGRGVRIRRRRRVLSLAGAGAVLAAAGGAVALALPPGAGTMPAAEAGWGPQLVNLSGPDLSGADKTCRPALEGIDQEGGPASPVSGPLTLLAGDARGTTSVLVYRDADLVHTCSITHFPEGDGLFLMAGEEWDSAEPGEHFVVLTGGGLRRIRPEDIGSEVYLDDPIDDGVTVLRVTDDVERLVLHIAGHDVEARVADGLAVAWFPAGTTDRDSLAATATAYAADGQELESGPIR
jgi:hypothetical protein